MKELFLSHAHAHLSYHPAEACVCWQCVWIHVLFIGSVSPSCHSHRLRRCAVDSQPWTCHQSPPNLICTQALTCTETNSRTHTHTHTHTSTVCATLMHTNTHAVGCSVFIRHAAEGCERTLQLRQITDKLNSSHSPTAVQMGENVAKWRHDWHPKDDHHTQGYTSIKHYDR